MTKYNIKYKKERDELILLEHKCEVCGKMWRKKLAADGKIVCNKHYSQFKKFGYFRDNSPRTQRDKNEIVVQGEIAYIYLYDKFYNVVDKAIIDKSDIKKVQNIKWRENGNGYVINNSHTNEYLHRRILNTDTIVDHINGNRLDNRKCNLRIADKSTNQMNVKYKGYYFINKKWIAKIKIHQKQIHLGSFDYEAEAKYARWYAEQILFKEFAYPKSEPRILKSRKKEIQDLVNKKVQRL